MKCSCLIPFYNEKNRISTVLNELHKVDNIHEIICVDDGSTDGSSKVVKKYPKVRLIINPENQGKTEAVKIGLKEVSGDYLLLFDADLRNVNFKEVEVAIDKIVEDKTIDMVIFKRIHAPIFMKIMRADTLASGERILKTNDLKKILKIHQPRRYQLEFAINKWAIDANKKVFWMPSSGRNTHKTMKFGIIHGLKEYVAMDTDMIKYLGIRDFIIQLFFFSRKRVN